MNLSIDAMRARWGACNCATLEWLLERPGRDGFLDSKVNPITLKDYGPDDGLRGRDWTYGWIQGRGLEALVTHAAACEAEDPGFAARLDARACALYERLAAIQAERGHVHFLLDRDLHPVRPDGNGVVAQAQPADIFTFSDTFAAKGLVAAAARFAPADLPQHLDYLARVITAIREGRFQMDEKLPLGAEALAAQPDDFGPKMIAIGACRMLEGIGHPEAAAFGLGFTEKILERHLDPLAHVLRNVPGEPAVNAGHGIELAGFALSSATLARPDLVERLCDVLKGSFRLAFHPPGIRLSVHAGTGAILSRNAPWWAQPEAIRAAAWALRLTGDPAFEQILRTADTAFFTHFWRDDARLAYQTLTEDGPLDFVPATPDLDPGYHTGLSLLAAEAALAPQTDARTGATDGNR